MNNNDNLYPTNVNEIIRSFSNMIRGFSQKETEWQISKENYDKKISELEGELKAHENINIDLLKRIRMLEYELARERGEKNINKEPNQNELFKDLNYPNLLKEDDLKFLEENSKGPSLLNVLSTIGINERLASNLFTDFELNRTELENLIKKDLEMKLKKIDNDNNILNNNEQINIVPNPQNSNQSNIAQGSNNNAQSNNPQNPEKPAQNLEAPISKSLPTYKFNLKKFMELRSHLDGVRKLSFIPSINTLISVGEDCLIKAWSLKNIYYNNQSDNMEPYLNFRGHTGPLFCVEHRADNLIFSGGAEGVIQIWNLPPPNQVNLYGNSEVIFALNIGFLQSEDEAEIYWSLKHSPKDNILVSLSSDSSIMFWETKNAAEFVQDFNDGKTNFIKTTKKKKSDFFDGYAIPTVCNFLKQDSGKLILGFNDATISLMDITKTNFIYSFDTYKGKSNDLQERVLRQPNCFACCDSIPLIYAGFEDWTIKSLDFREKLNNFNANNKVISDEFNAHSDAVTSLNIYKDLYLISVSHGCAINVWDTRKMNEPISFAVGSEKKWDESMWDSVLIEDTMTLCVACADSTIKLYKL